MRYLKKSHFDPQMNHCLLYSNLLDHEDLIHLRFTYLCIPILCHLLIYTLMGNLLTIIADIYWVFIMHYTL